MLTAVQQARCRELAASLDRGESAAYLCAEPSITPEMRMAIWNARTNFEVWAARGAEILSAKGAKAAIAANDRVDKTVAAARPARAETSLGLVDLDYWSDDDTEPPDDDDPIDDSVRDDRPQCPNCKGSGFDSSGGRCLTCRGSGKVPAEDQPDDEPDDDEDE